MIDTMKTLVTGKSKNPITNKEDESESKLDKISKTIAKKAITKK
jgi:hypothetical protein